MTDDLVKAAREAPECCMCGKTGLSTVEDGGPECQLSDKLWVCSRECYDSALTDRGTGSRNRVAYL